MLNFKFDGVYLCKYDSTKEGYDTYDGNGKFKRNKYGFLDKMYDLYRYGKTMEIGYSYILFKRDKDDGDKLPRLYMGSMVGEFTEVLKSLSKKSSYGLGMHEYNYQSLNSNKLVYLDTEKRECNISVLLDNNIIEKTFIDYVTLERISKKYSFFTFLNLYEFD